MMQIDIGPIKAELEELAGNMKCKVKLDKHIPMASSFRQTDQGYDIRLNPTHIRGSNQLQNQLNSIREALSI
jgi:hypothetical protein